MNTDPAHLHERWQFGRRLHHEKRYAESEAVLREVLALDPNHAPALAELGCVFVDAGSNDLGVETLRAAIALDPEFGEPYNNLGVGLMNLRRYPEAEVTFMSAVKLAPDFATAWDNLGNVSYRLQKFTQAEESFRRSIAIDPNMHLSRFGLGMTLLVTGNMDEGWRQYAGRFEMSRNSSKPIIPNIGVPHWRGEPLKGKSIVVWREQGFGDEIMCVRYAALLRELGATTVYWLCSAPLKELFSRVKGVTQACVSDEAPPKTKPDFLVPALELPSLFKTGLDTIPSALPYIFSDAQKRKYWKGCLPRNGGMNVGVVWRGSSTHLNDAKRSLTSLTLLAPLWKIPGVNFISLQKGDSGGAEAARPPADQPLIHLGGGLYDFTDTAAIIDQLDLLICADTAVAHVAGALGKPAWVMIPFELVDWRWVLGRDDSPWYPGALRLFRQGGDEEWPVVIERIAAALAEAKAKWDATGSVR